MSEHDKSELERIASEARGQNALDGVKEIFGASDGAGKEIGEQIPFTSVREVTAPEDDPISQEEFNKLGQAMEQRLVKSGQVSDGQVSATPSHPFALQLRAAKLSSFGERDSIEAMIAMMLATTSLDTKQAICIASMCYNTTVELIATSLDNMISDSSEAPSENEDKWLSDEDGKNTDYGETGIGD